MRELESKFIERGIGLKKAFEQAMEILSIDAIVMEEFEELYGAENIKRDKQYVERMESRFQREDTPEQRGQERIATIFQAILHEQIESNNWLGPTAHTIKTTRFDDVKNGVDEVVEFQEEKGKASHLALAIDVTFGAEPAKKLRRIKEEIEAGELARVKYFSSDFLGRKEELAKVPRVVVGAEPETIKELTDLWLKKNNKELAGHPIQFLILEEIRLQLETFENYARQTGHGELAGRYRQALDIIKEISAVKKGKKSDNALEDDKVFQGLVKYLKKFEKI